VKQVGRAESVFRWVNHTVFGGKYLEGLLSVKPTLSLTFTPKIPVELVSLVLTFVRTIKNNPLNSMKTKALLFLSCTVFYMTLHAQGVKIGTPGEPSSSSLLELESTSQGLLPPRMTSAQRDAIASPAEGLRIYNTDSKCENYFNGVAWRELCGACIPQPTTSGAGPDQLGLSGESATLAANTPAPPGVGEWSIVSGSGGSFSGSPTSSNPVASFTGLSGNTYTLRWTITNSCGSSQDEVQISFAPFVCGTSTLSDVQSNVYNTVQIGSQCWMRQNLKVTQYRNGTAIAFPDTDGLAFDANTTGAYAWYNNDISNGNTYGALYNWYATTNVNGLCPSGWHIPTDAEWTTLTTALGGAASAGGAMKTTTGWNSPNTGATNSSGFSGLPGGLRNEASYGDLGAQGYWWSSTQASATAGWLRYLFHSLSSASSDSNPKRLGHSVRCLKD